jgi:hypothetical protein
VQALRETAQPTEGGKSFLKRLVYLATAALVAMLILVPTAMAQER